MWLFGGKEVWVTVDEEQWLSAISKWRTPFRTVEQELWLSQLSVHQGAHSLGCTHEKASPPVLVKLGSS